MKKSILYVVVIVLIILSAYLYFSNIDVLKNEEIGKEISGAPFFIMKNNLSCEIKLSSDKKELGEVLSLLDLETNSPKYLSGLGGTLLMKKFFESDETLVFGWVGVSTGSTDIFVLNKKTGVFARTASGNLFGIFAFASKGVCR